MPRETPRRWTVQPPSLEGFKGRTLRAFLEELMRWLKQYVAANAQPGSPQDRFIAVTSGTITANAGLSGPLGSGNVTYKRIIDDDDLESKDTIEVKSIVLDSIGSGVLVIVERIEGVYVITSIAGCPS